MEQTRKDTSKDALGIAAYRVKRTHLFCDATTGRTKGEGQVALS